jgi:hypothetical protein
MARDGQRFPAGARARPGLCGAPLHDGGRIDIPVVAMRIGLAGAGPDPGFPQMTVCADCLADFAIAALGNLAAYVEADDRRWHQVEGRLLTPTDGSSK